MAYAPELLTADDVPDNQGIRGRYGMGFHYKVYRASPGQGAVRYVPSMFGSGGNEVILAPSGLISIRLARFSDLGTGEKSNNGRGEMPIEAMERFARPARRR